VVALKRRMDSAQQGVAIDGLGQKVDRAGLHRLHTHTDIAMPGEEHHRQRINASGQRPLQSEPTGAAGHGHIEQDAARAVIVPIQQEVASSSVGANAVPDSSQQSCKGRTQRFVIINDMYNGLDTLCHTGSAAG